MLFEATSAQHLSCMVRCRVIEYGVADGDEQLIVASAKASSEGLVAGLRDYAEAHPVPELLLRNPVFLPVVANDQRCLFNSHNQRFSTVNRTRQAQG